MHQGQRLSTDIGIKGYRSNQEHMEKQDNNQLNIIVCGSLAYDRIMDFPGHFSEHILPEKIHVLNVCFQINGVREKFGGTAGNIAYALRLMGVRPEISASIGRDYHAYLEWLRRNEIPTRLIHIVEDELTASAYITTDRADNQITGFNPGAMKFTSKLDFDALDPQKTFLIISPGNLEDMISYPRMCKQKGIDYIFDPGQSLPMLDPADIIQAIEGSKILMCNDYELDLITNKTGRSKTDLLSLTGSIIVTLGELGSQIFNGNNDTTKIPVARARIVKDPTGAGDSYRGGLISGLLQGKDITSCALMGSVCASFAVEHYGTQEYVFSPDEFEERLNDCYNCLSSS
jgi:adenosine kinase